MKKKEKQVANKVKETKLNPFLNKKFIISALLINLALRLYISYQPFEFIDGPLVQDDSYYVLTIAKNIANGLGPLYTDSHTNGFQPLYTFIITPIFFFVKADLFAPIRAMLVISSIIDTLTLLVLIKIFSKSRSILTFILLCVLWTFSFNVIQNSLNGLETSLSILMITISFYYFQKLKNENNIRNQIILGIVLGLAMLARIDNVFFVGSIVLFYFAYLSKSSGKFSNSMKNLAIVIVFCVIVYIPWLIYSYVYTGDIFPISGKALRLISYYQVDRNPTYENWYSLLLGASFKIIYSNNFILIFLFLFNVFVILLLKKQDKYRTILKELSAVNVLLLSNVIIFLSYIFYFFGYWYFSRYFYPMTLMFIFLAVIPFDYISSVISNKIGVRNLQILIVLVVFGVGIFTPEFKNLFYDKSKTNTGFMNLGLWADRSFKAGTIIGASQSGALGYFASRLKVINLDGVVNKECYLAMEEKRYFDYIKSKKVEYIIGWPSNFTMLLKNSPDFKEGELKPLGKITEFKTMNTQWNVAQLVY